MWAKYLTNGFWAMNRSEELTNPGLTASILVRMEDVTAKVMQATPNMEPSIHGKGMCIR
jgi:hypothetical protein